MTIKLNDILNLTDEEIKRTKIRFMVPSGDFNPSEEALKCAKGDPLNTKALAWNSNKISFREGNIAIGFYREHKNTWIMSGIMNVVKDNGKCNGSNVEYYKDFAKFSYRIVCEFKKDFEACILLAENYLDKIKVIEISGEERTVKKFPGFDNVYVSYNELEKYLNAQNPSWRNFLSSRRGVYLISDKSNGKLYVGSAYGEDGIYGRWRTYIESGYDKNGVETGKYPNREFQKLVDEEGLDYVRKNFMYSILETFEDNVSGEYIINRESWWKDCLQSRKFGYNAN